MFAIKNRMIEIPSNFQKSSLKRYCFCGKKEDMLHIYNCEMFNSDQPNLKYEKIFDGEIFEQIQVYRRFETNLKKREQIINENPPCDPTTVIRCTFSNG